MGFSFKHRRNVEAQVRQIAGEQIDAALVEAKAEDKDTEATVHGLRRRCKKLRGLVRLVGPDLEDAGRENAVFRDAAASLSAARDAVVMVQTFEGLLEFDRQREVQIARIDAEDISDVLGEQAKKSGQGSAQPFADFIDIFSDAAERASKWTVDGRGFDCLGDGFEATYKQMRQRLNSAEHEKSSENFHEWRKYVKYHGHHISLLKRTAPALLKARVAALVELGDALGDHHNLAVLAETLEGQPQAAAVHDVIAAQQDSLSNDAFALGRQLAAEKPGAIRQRFEAYWELLEERS